MNIATIKLDRPVRSNGKIMFSRKKAAVFNS